MSAVLEDTTPAHLLGNGRPVTSEQTLTDLKVTGTIPAELDGRYVRAGANPFTGKSDHPFLGDGMLHGVRLRDGKAQLGIVLGGSGQGEQLAANKVMGVRAALCNCLYTARMAREHNNANVLSMGARVVGIGLAEEIVQTFLATPFEGGRHERRVAQLGDIEREEAKNFGAQK